MTNLGVNKFEPVRRKVYFYVLSEILLLNVVYDYSYVQIKKTLSNPCNFKFEIATLSPLKQEDTFLQTMRIHQRTGIFLYTQLALCNLEDKEFYKMCGRRWIMSSM